ncbi:MAG: hypothetical protein OEW19_12515, partial [Acidobacteriota bacterium]|nr:hypothetical protein [Acidobacteriota bacterium]
MRPSLRASLGALFVFLATAAPQGQVAPILDRLRDLVGVDVFAAARNAPNLATGEPFVAELATSQASEVALAGLVWIDASPSRYVAAMSAIEQFERGGAVRNTHRLADTPTADDFASLSLSPVDFAALR